MRTHGMGVPSIRRENGRVVDLHRSRCGGEIGCQRLVVGKCEVAPDDLLCGFERKVRLRVGWGDKGCVWRRGRERCLRGTRFGAVEHGAEDGDEKLATFLSEGVAKRSEGNSWRDGLQNLCFSTLVWGEMQTLVRRVYCRKGIELDLILSHVHAKLLACDQDH